MAGAGGRLDDQVDLFARGGSPAEYFGLASLSVAPREQIHQDPVFEMRTAQRRLACQIERKSRIAPIKLWGLDEPLGAIHGIRGQAYDLKARLHEIQESMDLRLAYADIAPELGLIEQTAGSQAGSPHQSAKVRKVFDRAQCLQVAPTASLRQSSTVQCRAAAQPSRA